MARSRKAQTGDLPSQPDPRAPLDGAAFLRAARPVLAGLTADLLTRADSDEGIRQALQRHHQAEVDTSRTAEDYSVWRRRVVVQVAVAWLLSCVFVRVLEDRGLISARIAGPGASDSQDAFVRFAPSLGEREYLLTVFRELSHLPAAKALFHRDHNLVWRLGPSAEGCKALLRLFRTPHAEVPAFRFGHPDTRFLGDLYQDLDDGVREQFALLQTPDFVEQFILDRTLEPAFLEYGVDHTDLIDPTCGSGHFLLGAFPRFVERLRVAHPALDDRTLAAKALGHIYGVDINPYAVAIARFRLILQFLEAGGYTRLLHAPAPILNVIIADSLYYGFAGEQGDLGEREGQSPEQVAVWYGKGFSLEDPELAHHVLVNRTYAAVVGNPPYITVKDPALRQFYHDKYKAAAGKYALSAPFMERFFQLAKQGGGYVGQITSNSFMKREFGAALIEKVLRDLDLDLVVNTAGARLDLEWAEACHRKARSLIPTPQKYEPTDFRDTTYFRLRGKLDVPHERFISYPGAASNNDTAPVYGWAGWTHLQRALALLQLYYDRKSNGEWLPLRLIPLLAGLEELLPWVAQWHGNEVHPDTGERYVDAFETHIIAGCTELGVTRAQLIDWTPPDNSRTARAAHLDDDNDADAAAKPRKRRAAAPDGAAADISTAPEGTSENPSSEPSVPKRRGRPPKATAVPGDMSEVTSSEPSAPKRRGRPPKSAPE